jgi:hypothetical protein
MKNKKAVYALIFVVLLIWGIVFYRIFSYVQKSDETAATVSAPAQSNNHRPKNIPDIKADYRDPFLGSVPKKVAPASNIIRKEIKKPTAPWPTVVYSGMIRSSGKANVIAILQINGKEFLGKPGDTAGGIMIKKIYKDSVELVFNKEKRTFLK